MFVCVFAFMCVCVYMFVCVFGLCLCCVCVCVCVILITLHVAAPKFHCSKVNCFNFGHASCMGFISHRLDQKTSLFFCGECVQTLHDAKQGMFTVCCCLYRGYMLNCIFT